MWYFGVSFGPKVGIHETWKIKVFKFQKKNYCVYILCVYMFLVLESFRRFYWKFIEKTIFNTFHFPLVLKTFMIRSIEASLMFRLRFSFCHILACHDYRRPSDAYKKTCIVIFGKFSKMVLGDSSRLNKPPIFIS